jgi:hypothetical protein
MDINFLKKSGKPDKADKGIRSDEDKVDLNELTDLELKSPYLTGELTEAVTKRKLVNIMVDSKKSDEILKGTYVADILSMQGYTCRAEISKAGSMNWTCNPPH